MKVLNILPLTLLIIGTGTLIVSPASLAAQNVSSPNTGTDASEEWYGSAITLLKRGHNFEQAIVQLRHAISMQDKGKYHVALGCALTSRVVSIGDALNRLPKFTTDQAKYQIWLAAWEKAQKDHNDPLNGKPRPLPPVLITRDDKRPFTLKPPEARKQFDALSREAQSEFDLALASAKTQAERAELTHVRAWGLYLLRAVGKDIGISELPEDEIVIQAFNSATELAPKIARYWQSLGDSKLRMQWSLDKVKDKQGVIAAYQKAYHLNPNNLGLGFRLYVMTRTETPEVGKEALRQLSAADPDNASPAYRMAGLLLNETPYKTFHTAILDLARKQIPYDPDAIIQQITSSPDREKYRQMAQESIALIERGNQAKRYADPNYTPALPDLLIAVWSYKDYCAINDNNSVILWQSIRLPASGYATVAAREGGREEALRAAHALLGMGFKLMGDLASQEMPLDTDRLATLSMGFSNVGSAYRTLIDVYKALGDSDNADRTNAAYQAFEGKIKEYWQADKVARENRYSN